MSLQDEILSQLKAKFRFKKPEGDWMQEGQCPQCGQWQVYCHSVEPKIVQCGRVDKCGWDDTVRNLLPDLFEDWTKRAPPTPQDPRATAKAYLHHERGLDLKLFGDAFAQETFKDYRTGQSAATVRFPIANTYWERIIDRPGRFDRKAHFPKGGAWRGHCWMPATVTIEDLAKADDIWIEEGIFDAAAMTMAGLAAVSNMSTNPYPEHFLTQLRTACEAAGRADRPRLIFAFDVGTAGVTFSKKHVARARSEGWVATAAQVRPDGEGSKLDWNDLWLRHCDWKGDPEDAPLGEKAIKEYLHNGAITIAETAGEKAKLIVDHATRQARSISSFDMRHGNRLFWVKVKTDDDGERSIDYHEIANCAFRILYLERDDAEDETHYFLRIDFPDNTPTIKARFSSSAAANSGEFKKRLMAFAGMWTGTPEQLDRIMRRQTRQLKRVEPIASIGYSHDHQAWLLGDLAVHKGRVLKVNSENYFDVGKNAVKLRNVERLLSITYDADRLNFDWLHDLWTAYGARGIIVLAFFVMSVFAVQIRKTQKSLGFLEITGPPGSGKSTLIEFLWKLLGRIEHEGFDPQKATRPAFARNMLKVANLPVGLIESNRDDGGRIHSKNFEPNDLLTLYNGRSPRSTGKKTNGFEVSEPPFLGSIYLVQNNRIDAEPAVLQRLMSMIIDKSLWGPGTQDAAERLENWPIEDCSGVIVHVARQEAEFLDFFAKRYEDHRKALPASVEGLRDARCIKCHSQLAAAIDNLPKLFGNCRQEWVDQALVEVGKMALDRQQSAGGDHPLVADFWEKVEYLLSRESDTQHEDGNSLNRHRKADQFIAINLPGFEQRCRQNNIIPPPIDQLKKVLRHSKSRKFLKNTNVNPPGGNSRAQSCWVFEQPRIEGPKL